jgi:plasmid stabilization system protein ParE
MAYEIRYRPTALAQLDTIFTYLATHDQAAARRVLAYIKRTIGRLADFPYSARPSDVPDIRELPIVRYPYIVFYAVDEEKREVLILRVRHTSQDPAHHLD